MPKSGYKNVKKWGMPVIGSTLLANQTARRIGDWWSRSVSNRRVANHNYRTNRGPPGGESSSGFASGSKTQPVVAGPAREGRIENMGEPGQYSEYVGKYHKPYVNKSVLSTLAPQSYVTSSASQLLSAVGKQNFSTPLVMGGTTDYQNILGSASKIARIILTDAIGELYFANAELGNCRVTIYDCIARRDLPSAATFIAPAATWTQGSTDAGSIDTTIIGSTPWDNDLFNMAWKVVQRTEILLAGGTCHRHRVVIRPNKVVNGPAGFYFDGYKGVTYGCIVVLSGQPSHDSVTKVGTTIGTGGLDITAAWETKWKFLQTTGEAVTANVGLPATFANAERIVEEGGPTNVNNVIG